jgi:hypothetical protein
MKAQGNRDVSWQGMCSEWRRDGYTFRNVRGSSGSSGVDGAASSRSDASARASAKRSKLDSRFGYLIYVDS